MNRRVRVFLTAIMAAAGLAGTLQAQSPPLRGVYTQPVPPPQELLDRLNLKMAFRIYVPMDGRQDGLTTVQFSGRDLLVQTRSGMVALIDAETGATSWRQRVGRTYVAEHALAFNSREVYVINNVYLYALDRLTGAVNWTFRLPEGVASPPVADENMIYLASVTGLLTAYMLPRPDLFASAAPSAAAAKPQFMLRPGSRGATAAISPLTRSAFQGSTVDEALVGPHPIRSWSELTTLRLELPMLLTRDRLLVPTPSGTVLGMSKLRPVGTASTITYRFSTESDIRVTPAYYDGVAYIGGEDANLYALLTTGGRLLWRATIGVPISHRPAITDQDIYVVSARQGMMRLDRATGQPLWRIPASGGVVEFNAAAERFLAANPKYVYALDASRRFLVIDRRRGITLSGFDSTDFVFPITNDITDRIYLAANNGLIVCLHDREYPQAIRHHLREEEADSPLRVRLADRITDDVGSKDIPLEEMLNRFAKRFPPLRFRIEETAFRDAGRESPVQMLVKLAPIRDKPLGLVIKDLLATVQCVYEVIGDTIVILPAPAR